MCVSCVLQIGMFCFTGMTPEMVDKLASLSIYLTRWAGRACKCHLHFSSSTYMFFCMLWMVKSHARDAGEVSCMCASRFYYLSRRVTQLVAALDVLLHGMLPTHTRTLCNAP
jgi:hypothetical protein